MDSVSKSMLGLQQTPARANSGTKSRRAAIKPPMRKGKIWNTVIVIGEHDTTPRVRCVNCGDEFSAGSSRIKQHIMHKCPCDSVAFCELKDELTLAMHAADELKRAKAVDEVLLDSVGKLEAKHKRQAIMDEDSAKPKFKQQGIAASLAAATALEVDDAIAEMFYGLNIPAKVIEKPLFKKAIAAIKSAPSSYVPPTRARLMDDVLQRTTERLRAWEAPIRKNVMKWGGTLISDGWDDVSSTHLINVLVGVCKTTFFEGTRKLMSMDFENATEVAATLEKHIEEIGCTNIIQLCTDTCSVQKAAWAIVETNMPWITATCCGPHVLNLYLSDLGKLSEVSSECNTRALAC